MRILLRSPAQKPWLTCDAYLQQASGNGVASVTDYFRESKAAASHLIFQRVARTVQELGITPVETALICGPGRRHDEIILTMGVFPEITTVHVAEWHAPNLDRVIELLDPLRNQVKVDVIAHHNDLRDLQTVPQGTAQFAFANKIFDLFHQDHRSIYRILRGVARSLVPDGVFFSLDHPIDNEGEVGAEFNRIAMAAGLRRLKRAGSGLYSKI